MISSHLIKEIILTNEEFILHGAEEGVPRECLRLPERVKKVVVFYGVRRSGKTFILYSLFRKYKDRALYVDFEDERLSGFTVEDFEKLSESFYELKPECAGKEAVFLLDEVQGVPGWEKFARRMSERGNAMVFVSGSSSKVMPSEIHTSLRGRSWSVEVTPFSFREYLIGRGIDPGDKKYAHGRGKSALKRHLGEYLLWGGFPEVVTAESLYEKKKIVTEYLSAMYFRDLVERYRMTNIPLLEALRERLFSAFSTRFTLSAFYRHFKDLFPFSKDLLYGYYKNFLQSMLVYEVRKYAESAYKRMRNPAKIYLVDTALALRTTAEDTGRRLENAVFLELRRRGYDVFYFEEKRECDFVAVKERKMEAIQVAAELNEGNEEREIGGLVEACRALELSEGVIITLDDERELKVDELKVRLIPAWKWLLWS